MTHTVERPPLPRIKLQYINSADDRFLGRMARRGDIMVDCFTPSPWLMTAPSEFWVDYFGHQLGQHGLFIVDAIDMETDELIGFCCGIATVDKAVVEVTELAEFGFREGDAYCAAVALDSRYRGRRNEHGHKLYPMMCDVRTRVLLAGNKNRNGFRSYVRTHRDCTPVRFVFETRSSYELVGTGKKDLGHVVWDCVIYARDLDNLDECPYMYDYAATGGHPEVEGIDLASIARSVSTVPTGVDEDKQPSA